MSQRTCNFQGTSYHEAHGWTKTADLVPDTLRMVLTRPTELFDPSEQGYRPLVYVPDDENGIFWRTIPNFLWEEPPVAWRDFTLADWATFKVIT